MADKSKFTTDSPDSSDIDSDTTSISGHSESLYRERDNSDFSEDAGSEENADETTSGPVLPYRFELVLSDEES